MKNRRLLLKRLVPIMYLIILIQVVFSQPTNVDSLRRIVSDLPDNATKAGQIIQVAKSYLIKQQPDSALFYCNIAYDLSVRIKYLEGEADALYLKSIIYKGNEDLKMALPLAEKCADLFIILNDSHRIAKGYYNLALAYKESENNDLAMVYSQKSLAISRQIDDSTLVLGNYNCIGSIFSESKTKGDSAAFYYIKALEISKKKGNSAHQAIILNNLGMIFNSEKNYELAKDYIRQSLELSLQLNDLKQIANSKNYLGIIAASEAEYSLAEELYMESLEICKKIDYLRGISDANLNAGDLFYKMKKYREALEYFDNALSGYRQLEFERGIILALMNKSAVYSELGKTSKALEMQDSCLQIMESISDERLKLLIFQNIADNYYKQGNYKNAYETVISSKALSEKIYDIEKGKAIHSLLVKYEKEQDQSRILNLEKENLRKTSQRNGYLFGGLAIVVVALFTILYLRQRARHERVVSQQKIIQLEEEKKLMAARLLVEGQEEERKRIAMELHDGLGVSLSATRMQFSTIMDKSPENKELIERATKMLEQASGDVRKISHNMMPGLLTKLGFYEAVEDLFEKISDTGDIRVMCNITGDQERLPGNREIMLYRIVQELVNNTLKHAGASVMSIRIQILPEALDITYSDDGRGFDYEKALESGSLGLKSIMSRVDFLNGKISVDTQTGKGAAFHIVVPVTILNPS